MISEAIYSLEFTGDAFKVLHIQERGEVSHFNKTMCTTLWLNDK